MNKKAKILFIIGIIFIILAGALAVYFTNEEQKSSYNSKKMFEKLVKVVSKDNDEIKTSENGFEYIVIDNIEYIGYIEIPTLNLKLPITNGYTYSSLKKSPALYYGTISNNLVICGHSYKSHFGYLSELQTNDKVIFTDVRGNKYSYKVELIEELKPYEIEKMIESEFDLTLYTCTKDSMNRVTVRCNREGKEVYGLKL